MENKISFSEDSGEALSQKTDIEVIVDAINTYPELSELVGETEFSPEQHSEVEHGATFGKQLFPNATAEQIKEFDRTALSLVLMNYCFDGEYEKFTASQAGDNKLSKDTFDAMQNFYQTSFDTPDKKSLLEFYIIVNDLGKSQRMIDLLKSQDITVSDHDEALSALLDLGEVPSMQKFDPEQQDNIKNVLKYGVNVGQLIQGECVDYSFKDLDNLSDFERRLMMGEAMMDIAGVAGHVNQKGSVILNEPTTENLLLAERAIEEFGGKPEMFDSFLQDKAKTLGIESGNHDVDRTVARVCMMMRLSQPQEIETVQEFISEHANEYSGFIAELNETGYGERPAILPYYAPATFANTLGYYKKHGSPDSLSDTMNAVVPFLQKGFEQTRQDLSDRTGQGIITMMLRDAALVASEDPDELKNIVVVAR